jgi:hypothetical protein
MVTGYEDLARRITELEKELTAHDRDIAKLIRSMKALLWSSPIPPSRQIGFQIPDGWGFTASSRSPTRK